MGNLLTQPYRALIRCILGENETGTVTCKSHSTINCKCCITQTSTSSNES